MRTTSLSGILGDMKLPVDPLAELWRGASVSDPGAGPWLRPPPRIRGEPIITPVPVDPLGVTGPTKRQARGPYWRRTSLNLYVPGSAVVHQPEQRIAEVMAGVPSAAATGWASLHLTGARYFNGEDMEGRPLPVPLALGRGQNRRSIAGARVNRASFEPDDVVLRHGVRCLTVHRALFDEVVRRKDLRQGVQAIEMAYYAELTSSLRFGDWLDRQPRRVGAPAVRAAHALACEGAESPPETAMHLVWTLDAGLPTPLLNPEVYSLSGRTLGRVDLLDPDLGVVGEYDGEHHRETRARRRDVRREELIRDHGLEYFSVVAGELSRPGEVIRRMHGARARARGPGQQRRWTLTPPSGVRILSLEERLTLRPPPR